MQSSTIKIIKISEYVDVQKILASATRLRRELRDAQDALDVLKKAINILGK